LETNVGRGKDGITIEGTGGAGSGRG